MFEDATSEAGDARAYVALARVDADADGKAIVEVVTRASDGAILGVKVDCTIVEGPFQRAQVAAQLCARLGDSTPTPPEAGQVLLVAMPHGTPDRGCYAMAVVPGGAGVPMKGAVGGVDVSNPDSLAAMRVDAPPRGVGSIGYYRGANWAVRLKGKSDGFNSGAYIDADDGAHMRLVWDTEKRAYCCIMRDARGAMVQVCNGEISMQSPNAENGIYVTDEGVRIVATKLETNATNQITFDGAWIGLCLGPAVPVPTVNSVAIGIAGPANTVSTRVFAGIG